MVSVPPLSVFWSELRASMDFLPSMTWYLSTSAVTGVPTSALCLSKAELDGARSVYSPPEVDALLGECGRELVEVVIALDVGLVVAECDAVGAPEDLRAIECGECLGDRGLELRRGLGGDREGRSLIIGTGHEDRVDRLDDTVVALDIRRPVGRLGGTLGLETDDRVVEPVLAELAVRRERSTVECLLVRVEGIHRLLALDHVVLERVSRDRCADLVVVLVEG